jgi:hypothetical protein
MPKTDGISLSPDQAPIATAVPLQANVLVNHNPEPEYKYKAGFSMSLVLPAIAQLSAMTVKRLGEVSMQNGLGTTRPAKLLLGLDESKQFLYLIPTVLEDPEGTIVHYAHGKTSVNLYTTFTALSRRVLQGTRECYTLAITPDKVQIGQINGFALVTRLDQYTTLPVHNLTDAQKAKRKKPSAQLKGQSASTTTEPDK